MMIKSPFTGEDLPESVLKLLEHAKFGSAIQNGRPLVLVAMIIDGETIITAMTPSGASEFAASLLKAALEAETIDPSTSWLN